MLPLAMALRGGISFCLHEAKQLPDSLDSVVHAVSPVALAAMCHVWPAYDMHTDYMHVCANRHATEFQPRIGSLYTHISLSQTGLRRKKLRC